VSFRLQIDASTPGFPMWLLDTVHPLVSGNYNHTFINDESHVPFTKHNSWLPLLDFGTAQNKQKKEDTHFFLILTHKEKIGDPSKADRVERERKTRKFKLDFKI